MSSLQPQHETAVILGSGPSASAEAIAPAKGKADVFAVNKSWRLYPDALAVFGTDWQFWHYNDDNGFKGLRFGRCDPAVRRDVVQIRLLTNDEGNVVTRINPGPFLTLGFGMTSAYQATNLACQLGYKRIALLGVDCTPGYSPHVGFWRDSMNSAAPELMDMGIDIADCGEHSTLTAWPKLQLSQFLN